MAEAGAAAGVCTACNQVKVPVCTCPPGFTCVAPDGALLDSFPECVRPPAGYLSPVGGDRIRPLPCPHGSFCPYGLPVPLPCPTAAFCSAARSYRILHILALATVLAILACARPCASAAYSAYAARRSSSSPPLLPPPSLSAHHPATGIINPPPSPSSSSLADATADLAPGLEIELRLAEVKVKGRSVIDRVSGVVRPGAVVAVMGPSGAGKTTLLRTLRGSVSLSRGAVLVNGAKTTLARYRAGVGYVPQDDDTLDPQLTVASALYVSSLLRAPAATPWRQRTRAVDTVLADMMLEHVRAVGIGSPADGVGLRTLSGGERKRVNIAVELVASPAVILLDEPTTGLDSFAAAHVVECLHRASRAHGATVIATIHQPSEELFATFDDVILLAAGAVVYWGSVSGAYAYFGSTSPDAILDAISADQNAAIARWRAQEGHISLHGDSPATSTAHRLRTGPPAVFQFGVQLGRIGLRWLGATRELAVLCLLFAIAGAFLGLAFMGPKFVLPPPASILDSCPAAAVQLTEGQKWSQPCSASWPTVETQGLFCMYACMVLGVLGASYGVATVGRWLPVYWREAASGASRPAYMAALIVWDTGLCYCFALAFVFAFAIVADPWGAMGEYVSLVFMFVWVSVGIGMLGVALLSPDNAAVAATLVAVVLGVFSGLPFQRTPTYTFYFAQAVWRAEAAPIIDAASPSSLYWISVYAAGNYGYHVDSGVWRVAMGWMGVWGGALRLVAFFLSLLRHRSKQR